VQEGDIEKLVQFGFTVNQAKIYWSIVQSGITCVGKISEVTRLHRQDIYKTLPKLEKKGLIAKTITTPIMIEALPLEKALGSLVSAEEEKANQRIALLKAYLKEIVDNVKTQKKQRATPEEETHFTMLETDAQITNASDFLFENTKKECILVTNTQLITRRMSHYREQLRKLANKGVKIRVLVEDNADEKSTNKIIRELKPYKENFEAKLIHRKRSTPYRICDNQELFIRRKKVTESGVPAILWTNGRSIVEFYKENFEEDWKSLRTITIYPKMPVKRL